MKYIHLIAILICLSYQSKEQVMAANSLTMDSITTTDKVPHLSKHKGSYFQQGGTLDFMTDVNRLYQEREAERQQQQQAKAQQGGTLDFTAGIERLYQEEMAKQQADSQTNPLRVTILTYGSIGIVLSFIIIAIVTFSILYVRRNKDNPKCHKP